MLTITCPKCGLSGKIDPDKIPAAGRDLSCPRCKVRFFVPAPFPVAPPPAPPAPLPSLTDDFVVSTDEIRAAAGEGIIAIEDAERLIAHLATRIGLDATPPTQPRPQAQEPRKGLNPVMVAYYFGAMLMISACAWFLGDKWKDLGSPGIFVTVLIYMAIAGGLGLKLRERGYTVGGGLLVTVAVCLVPLLTYTVEDMTGLWPGARPGSYKDYYPWIHGSWIVMELATIAAALFALRRVRFAFLTAPIAFSFWFFSMDIAALLLGKDLDWDERKWISVIVGLFTLAVGYCLERTLHRPGEARREDFAFWCYLFGLFAFWGGLTAMNSDSEVGKFVYCLINLGLVGLALRLRRSTFLVFGAFGVHIYLGHLAYDLFRNSVLFPFALALLGLSLILVTIWAQKRFHHLLAEGG